MICKDNHKVFDNSLELVYKYDQVPHRKNAGKPWKDGFSIESCYPLTNNLDDEEYCFFLNPHINQGDGLVIFTRPSVMNQSLEYQFNLASDTRTTSAVQLISMPEKGGIGALASRSLLTGERVTQGRAVAIVSAEPVVYQSGNLPAIRKIAVDLLPLHSRRKVALMIGSGETEAEWISNAFDVNSFSIKLGDGHSHFALISGEPTRLNHACRPNTQFYMNTETLEVFMHALKPIKAGEELTISYHRMDAIFKDRQTDLKDTYNFDCQCSYCSMSKEKIEESDNRIRRIYELRDGLLSKTIQISKSIENELIDLYEKVNIQ
ncbi:hypothetical protein BY996DRAFT_4580891 [Phakopsora pachyrhizi]|nr:hypothetical protein BY996DRAFT_4580891 [Phakopsora pachyrhizi]